MQRRNVAFIAIASPVAGAEVSHTVPAGKIWRVLNLTLLFTTSAGVANREVVVNFGAAGSSGTYPAGQITAASLGRLHVFAQSGVRGVGAVNITANIPIGEVVLKGGDIISTNTSAIQVGDQYSAISLVVEELG